MDTNIIRAIIALFGILFGGAAGYIEQPWGFILGLVYGILVMLLFIMK